MVTRAAIRTMLETIGAMETRVGVKPFIVPFIRCPSCLDKDTVIERHFNMYPDERDASLVVITEIQIETTIDELTGYRGKGDAAWRAIAAESERAA